MRQNKERGVLRTAHSPLWYVEFMSIARSTPRVGGSQPENLDNCKLQEYHLPAHHEGGDSQDSPIAKNDNCNGNC